MEEGIWYRGIESMDKRIECERKQIRRVLSNMDMGIESTDKISELPDHILHQILWYLPTNDVVRINVLSKTWHRICSSFPVWDFSESLFGLTFRNSGMQDSKIKDRREKFFSFVQNSLLRQCNHNREIQKFRLSMTVDFDTDVSRIHHCLALATQNGVKELDLNFQVASYDYEYCLPHSIFSVKALTMFKLSEFNLKLSLDHNAINWPSLRVLLLNKVHVNERVIQNLICGCPLIEKMALIYCFGLRSILLSGFTKLNKVKVVDTGSYIKRIEIDVPSLLTFYFSGGRKACHIDVTACKNLEVLKLWSCTMTNQECQDLISKFSGLKTLTLHCLLLERIKILSRQLEKLKLSSYNLVEATIAAPSLQSFKYYANTAPDVFSLDRSSIQQVTLKLFPYDLYVYLFLKLREYLRNFNQIKHITLHIISGSISFEPERLKEVSMPDLPVVKHLKLKISSSLSGSEAQARAQKNYEALVNGLLWVCHPESLLLVSGWGFNNEFMRVLCQKLMRRAEGSHCCAFSSIRCWQHSLKGIQIEQFEGYGRIQSHTCCSFFESLSTLAPQQKISFLFEW